MPPSPMNLCCDLVRGYCRNAEALATIVISPSKSPPILQRQYRIRKGVLPAAPTLPGGGFIFFLWGGGLFPEDLQATMAIYRNLCMLHVLQPCEPIFLLCFYWGMGLEVGGRPHLVLPRT